MHAAGKPICALCIAPVILAKIIPQVLLTIGNDATVIADMERVGAHHQRCELDNVVIDRLNKVVTTPCYMYEASIDQIYEAVSRAIQATRSFL